MALTPKQEKFCQCIVSGMDGKNSYLTAYANNSNDNTAYKESGKLLAREDIQARIMELRKPLIIHAQTMALTERQKQIEFIRERIEICKQKDDENSLIRWNDQLNKILALYKETDTEQSKENPFETLDNDKLRRFLA